MKMPTGDEIATWWDERDYLRRFATTQTAEGYDYSRDGGDYCYVWMTAYVDLDVDQYFLLDVRNKNGDNDEMRDFLFVAMEPDQVKSTLRNEWHMHPILFGAPPEQHQYRFVMGMTWFAQLINAGRS